MIRVLRRFCHCCGTDTALWYIHHTSHSHVILTIIDNFQIGQNIFDLFALIEVHTAHNSIWYVACDKFFF